MFIVTELIKGGELLQAPPPSRPPWPGPWARRRGASWRGPPPTGRRRAEAARAARGRAGKAGARERASELSASALDELSTLARAEKDSSRARARAGTRGGRPLLED